MKKFIKPTIVVTLAVCALSLSGCATLFGNGVMKAPCSPTAGLTDPCGNRIPINSLEEIDPILAEQIAAPERV